MPKNKKKGKQENDEDFDAMLAEFREGDLATASSAASSPASSVSSPLASSSSSSRGVYAGPSVWSLPSAAKEVACPNVSEDAITGACLAGNLA